MLQLQDYDYDSIQFNLNKALRIIESNLVKDKDQEQEQDEYNQEQALLEVLRKNVIDSIAFLKTLNESDRAQISVYISEYITSLVGSHVYYQTHQHQWQESVGKTLSVANVYFSRRLEDYVLNNHLGTASDEAKLRDAIIGVSYMKTFYHDNERIQ